MFEKFKVIDKAFVGKQQKGAFSSLLLNTHAKSDWLISWFFSQCLLLRSRLNEAVERCLRTIV